MDGAISSILTAFVTDPSTFTAVHCFLARSKIACYLCNCIWLHTTYVDWNCATELHQVNLSFA